MKWISQHIWDFISRFRSDVYLENISTGTIASGGNLGLDSDNKIVKQSDTGITDLHGAGVDGSDNQLLTDDGDGTITSEAYLTFVNNSNISTLSLLSDQDTGDYFTIATTTHGATTLTTLDDDATAANLVLDIDGTIDLDAASIGKIEFSNAGTTYADFSVHHDASYLRMYENGGASTEDYFDLNVAEHGVTVMSTIDNSATAAHMFLAPDGDLRFKPKTGAFRFMDSDNAADYLGLTIDAPGDIHWATNDASGGNGAHYEIEAQGNIILDAALGIQLEPGAGNNILLDGTVTVDGGSVTGITTLGVDSVSLTAVQTSGESFVDNDTSIMTSAAIDDKINTKYSYVYMTWSASGTSSMDGSDPEWVFPNTAKGIYEEDWTKDENIKATSVGTTTYTTSRHTAINSLVIPHSGYCVGFHAHGRNDDNDNAGGFKAGLFHYEGSTTGTTNNGGIDYGNTGATSECTLRWIATADEAEASGGADGSGSHSFKGPCKLVSNTDALAVTAGDALLPAIMGPDGSDEIFVTMTIILKVPLTV